MPRTFFGFMTPPKVSTRLAEECGKLAVSDARVRWTPPELMHVTLRFLGETRDDVVPEAAAVLTEAAAEIGPMRLVARGLGSFPKDEPPRVVYVGVVGESPEDEARLRLLRKRLDDGAKSLGLRPEKGSFTPHVTLGRLRADDGADDLLRRLGPGVRREFAHFRIDAASLFESTAVYEEKVYAPLATAKLKGPTGPRSSARRT
jgi:RNA 2',3'-cyclic 3'-phosphodiesterase